MRRQCCRRTLFVLRRAGTLIQRTTLVAGGFQPQWSFSLRCELAREPDSLARGEPVGVFALCTLHSSLCTERLRFGGSASPGLYVVPSGQARRLNPCKQLERRNRTNWADRNR